MRSRSLRAVVLVPVLVAIGAGFAAFAVYADRVEQQSRIADIDSELGRAQRAGAPRGPAERAQPSSPAPTVIESTVIEPEATEVGPPVQLLLDANGTVLATGGGENPFETSALVDLATRIGFSTRENENYRILVTRTPDQTLSVTALTLDDVDAAVADFRLALLIGGSVILAIVTIVVWYLTTALVRPVTNIGATAGRIADGDLETEINTTGGSREIELLSLDLARMVTNLRASVEASEQSAVEAMQARDDMHRFLADIAHELRTPLTALKGYSELYAAGMLENANDVDRAMARIGAESERLHLLANDMLRLAIGETEAGPMQAFDVATVVSEVVDDLRAAHPSRRIDLTVDPESSYRSLGRPERFHQAVLNLAANACQHSPSETAVRIEVAADDATVEVTVIDQGAGIGPQDAERIFLPFYRAESSRHRKGQGGAGLGLALVKQIADQHAGDVVVSATQGGGATFTSTIPLLSDARIDTSQPGHR